LPLPFLENREAAALLLLGQMVLVTKRGGVRPPRVFEGEDGVVFHLVQEIEGLLEIVVGLAREAYDYVGGDGYLTRRCFHPLDAAHVLVARVRPLHAAEYVRRARLHREVHVIAKRRGFADGVDYV